MFLALEAASIAALFLAAGALITTDRSSLVFLGVVVFIALWGAQAVDAYQQAVELGAQKGGAVQIIALAPVGIVLFTAFWLVGGSAGTPEATLQRYVSAWRHRVPDAAVPLLASSAAGSGSTAAATVSSAWDRDDSYIRGRIAEYAARPGTSEQLDAEDPFSNLTFELVPTPRESGSGRGSRERATAVVRIVQRVTVPSSLFGIFPAASQETQVLEEVGTIELSAAPAPTSVGLPSNVWYVDAVRIGNAPAR